MKGFLKWFKSGTKMKRWMFLILVGIALSCYGVSEIIAMKSLSILDLVKVVVLFIIGFILYLPFIVIDMVVASTLMSMGMMMLPPTTISMPFKILLFVMADGWNLIIGQLVDTFK